MSLLALVLSLAACDEATPLISHPEGSYVHFQSFSDADWNNHWKVSQLPNVTGVWEVKAASGPQASDEKLIFMQTAQAYYGLSTQFDSPLDLTDKTLVVQYEVRMEETLECGGAYMKLFGKDNFEPTNLCNETRYIIMFGPDKCGSTNKVHFIFRHKNPKTGVFEEKHLKDAPAMKRDKNMNHLYTLIVRPDNSFEILIDAESVKQGNLLTDFAPSVNPPKEIDDPTDVKPADWVDDEMIDDPEAKKPDDWDETQPEFIKDPSKLEAPPGWLPDEPKFIADPDAQKPEDWDDDIHGEWEAPTIPNPKCEEAPGCGEYEPPLIKNELYKGKWRAPRIKNPAYKGPWKARQIPNPDYVEDLHPHNFQPLVGAGFELWMVNKEIGFTNVFIGTDEAAVHQWNKAHFIPKHKWQVEEEKKNKPKDEKRNIAGEGFLVALQDFAETLKNAWLNLYTESAPATIAFTALAVLIPVILFALICCRRSPKPVAEPKKEEKKEEKKKEPKVQTVEEEDEKSSEEAQEEEPAKKPEPEEPKKRTKKAKKAENF